MDEVPEAIFIAFTTKLVGAKMTPGRKGDTARAAWGSAPFEIASRIFWKVYPVRGLRALMGDGKNVAGPRFALGLAGLRQSAPK